MAEKKKVLNFASRDDFFRLELPFEDVAVPEFGEGVVARVKAMDALRYYHFGIALRERGVEYYRPALVAFTVVNEDNGLIFSMADIDQLAAMDYEVIQRLSDAAARVERLRKGDQEETTENLEMPQD